MPTQEEKKTLNIFDAKVFDDFTKLVEDNGYTQYRAAEGALRAFIAIPPEAQVALMSNNANAQEILLNTFRDMGLQVDLQKLSPTQRTQILTIAKEAAKKVSRKK